MVIRIIGLNNNTLDNDRITIMRAFSQFIWRMQDSSKQPLTLRPSQPTWDVSSPISNAIVYMPSPLLLHALLKTVLFCRAYETLALRLHYSLGCKECWANTNSLTYLLSPKACTHFTFSRRVGGWVDLDTTVKVCSAARDKAVYCSGFCDNTPNCPWWDLITAFHTIKELLVKK